MYLIVSKLWSIALPYLIALRVIGDKVAINKSCCQYLWGVIVFSEKRNSVYRVSRKCLETDTVWSEKDEEVLALIAADMHEDDSRWEMLWRKDGDPKLLTSEIPWGMDLEK